MGQTFQGGGSYSLGDFGVEYTTPEQILVTYTAISPNTGLSSSVSQVVNINVGELAPTVSVTPSQLASDSDPYPFNFATGEMRHTVPFEEGVDYVDKYLYNTDTAHILYSATDPNQGDIANSVEFGVLTGVSVGTPSIEMVDVMAQAQSSFGSTFGGVYEMFFSALVYDSTGLWDFAYWRVRVTNYAPPLEPTLLGDANSDGTLNILDVVTTVNYVIGNITLGEQGIANTDINQDGVIDVLDIVTLVQEILPE